ncbi:hypothetical protein BaRGS_00022709, partial [Batillaria attramentaria]
LLIHGRFTRQSNIDSGVTSYERHELEGLQPAVTTTHNSHEGNPVPPGTVLERVHVLLVSAPRTGAHKPFGKFPTPPTPCNFTHITELSEKSQLYSQTLQTYLAMRKSKSGLHHFKMTSEADFCGENDVPPTALLGMVKLGEVFAKKYSGKVVPALHTVPEENLKIVRSVAGQEYFQSAAAFLHGLLSEKQFMRVDFQKIESHVCRGLGSPCWCDGICHIDTFMQKAYRDEHDVFKDPDTVFFERKRLYDELRVRDYQSAKQLVLSVTPWLCELKTIPCDGNQQCLSISNSHVNQLLTAIGKHNQYLSANSLFASYAAADTRTYFKNMFAWFLEKTLPVRFRVDVVDDFFLLKVLAALGIPVLDHIFPGSQLVIEQYVKAKSKRSGKFWRILYNGDVITESVPSCVDELWHDLCGSDAVRTHVESLVEGSMFGDCGYTKDEL